jgi:PAS domain S-box-containing protein
MKNSEKNSDALQLRKRAMELLKSKPLKSVSHLSEAETLMMIHEFEVHQVELELQNEELMLARSEIQDYIEKYSELYDFAPSGYFTLSREGEILELNLSGANMLCKERLNLKDSQFGFFVSDDTKPIFNLFLEKIFLTNSKESCEVTLLIKGKPHIHVYLCGIATENGDKCIINAVDISDRKLAENVLTNSEVRYRRVFETAKDGILILDAKTGKILDVNPFLIELLGYSREQFIEKAIWEIGFFKDIAANRDKFLELQKKEYARYENLPIETANGQKINVEFVSNVYFENVNKVIQCIIRDITKRKQSEIHHGKN